jgi:ribosomal protein L4
MELNLMAKHAVPGHPEMSFVKKTRTRSVKEKLEEFGFDPLEKMVNVYQKLEREDEFHTQLRENKLKGVDVVELDEQGRQKARLRYSSVAHTTILGQQQSLASDLMKYVYVKPESDVKDDRPPININVVGK